MQCIPRNIDSVNTGSHSFVSHTATKWSHRIHTAVDTRREENLCFLGVKRSPLVSSLCI